MIASASYQMCSVFTLLPEFAKPVQLEDQSLTKFKNNKNDGDQDDDGDQDHGDYQDDNGDHEDVDRDDNGEW